ncbi:hypothetical protein [Clostridium sp.]|uniref:hypothetical protein n=1 Tax=Clostridium sp. TaxID=1506 RepID=UPI002FCCB351
MNKKAITTIITGILVTSVLYGCGNSTAKKAVEEGKIAIASNEYDKGKNLFKLASDEGSEIENKETYDMLNGYLEAEKEYEDGNYNKALELLNNIKEVGDYQNLKNDIKNLHKNIEEKEKIDKEYNDNIKKINGLIKEESLNKAKELVDNIDIKDLSDKQKSEFNKIKDEITKKQEELKKQEQKKAEATKKKENSKKEDNVNKGLEIIQSKGFKNIVYEGIVKQRFNIPEMNNKPLYHYIPKDEFSASNEFYYDASNNKMYMINQGMWFIINENYKNVTPKDGNNSYEYAEGYRKMLLEGNK